MNDITITLYLYTCLHIIFIPGTLTDRKIMSNGNYTQPESSEFMRTSEI